MGSVSTAQPLSSLAPGLRGGVDVPGDHQVDNRLLVAALLGACEGSGVSLMARRATGVAMAPGPRAVGVELDGGSTLRAGNVVVTAGCHSHELGGLPLGTLPPVRPVKGLTLRLAAPPDVPRLRQTVRRLPRHPSDLRFASIAGKRIGPCLRTRRCEPSRSTT